MEHLKLLMRLSLADDANCVDVGANVGDVLGEMALSAPRGRHIAYEPLPELAAELRRQFPDIDVRNAALSDTPGEQPFFRVRSASTRSSFFPDRANSEDLEQLMVRREVLDEALPPDYAPALIKIDVEGAEAAVLRGARRILEEHRPTIVLEHGSAPLSATREIYSLLTSPGLRVFDMDGRGSFSAAEFETVVARGKVWNFVAHV